jgi:hypothetical protein
MGNRPSITAPAANDSFNIEPFDFASAVAADARQTGRAGTEHRTLNIEVMPRWVHLAP